MNKQFFRKEAYFVRDLYPEQKYEMSTDDRPENKGGVKWAASYLRPVPRPDYERSGDHPNSDLPMASFGEMRADQTRTITKLAGDVMDTVQGAGLGGAAGYGLGHLAQWHGTGKIDKFMGSLPLTGRARELVPPMIRELFKKNKYTKGVVAGLTGLGVLSGGLGGYMAKDQLPPSEDGYNPPQYMNHFPEFGKSANTEHLFITETGTKPVQQSAMPIDVKDAVDLENPYLKYLPLSAGALTGGAAAMHSILKRDPLTFYKVMSAGFGGVVGGSIGKNLGEREYAAPYLEELARRVDKKYKEKSATEYISDVGVEVVPTDHGPRDLQAVIAYRHPLVNDLPLIGAGAGHLIGALTHRSLPGSFGGAVVGGSLGAVAKTVLMDLYLNEYRKKYLNTIRGKYGLAKIAEEFEPEEGNVLGKGLTRIDNWANRSFLGSANNMVGTYRFTVPMIKKWIPGGQHLFGGIEKLVGGLVPNKFKAPLALAGRVSDKIFNYVQFPAFLANAGAKLTGIGGTAKTQQALEQTGAIKGYSNAIKPYNYTGNLKGLG